MCCESSVSKSSWYLFFSINLVDSVAIDDYMHGIGHLTDSEDNNAI